MVTPMSVTMRAYEVADQPTVDAAYQILVDTHDPRQGPLLERDEFDVLVTGPFPGHERIFSVAEVDGVPVGYVSVELPQLDNQGLARIMRLAVPPRRRRQGIGRAMFAYVRELAATHDRVVVTGSTESWRDGSDDIDPNAAFATAMGAKAALIDIRSRLELATVAPEKFAQLRTDAERAAAGYTVLTWELAPAEYIDDIAYLDSRLLADAPTGDLVVEPEKVDAQRIREMEETARRLGSRPYNAGVRHDASGKLVAWTQLVLSANSAGYAWQQITLVDPDHRGHRLGLLIKVANLQFAQLHEPQLTVVDTWNAADNGHMIAVNRALGFKPVGTGTEWQVKL